MPVTKNWITLHPEKELLNEEESIVMQDRLCSHICTHSKERSCNIHSKPSICQMKTSYLKCNSSTCKGITNDENGNRSKCEHQLKIIECVDKKVFQFWSVGAHKSESVQSTFNSQRPSVSPRKPKLTQAMKTFIENCRVVHNMKAKAIYHDFQNEFADVDPLPTAEQVRNFANQIITQYSDTYENVEREAENLIKAATSEQSLPEDCYSYGITKKIDGKYQIGNGSDLNPFFLTLTSVYFLQKFIASASLYEVQLHVDFTFKTNTLDYPVLIIGYSDFSGCFHLLTIIIASKQDSWVVTRAFRELKLELYNRFNYLLSPQYVMADGGLADNKSIQLEFPGAKRLMCFFNVMKNVRENIDKLKDQTNKSQIYSNIYYIHLSADEIEFNHRCMLFRVQWSNIEPAFYSYFHNQWLQGSNKNWQVYCNPRGYALTNNPLETFNWHLKKAVIDNIMTNLPLSILGLKKLIEEKCFDTPFLNYHIVSKRIESRALQLDKENCFTYENLLQDTAMRNNPDNSHLVCLKKVKNHINGSSSAIGDISIAKYTYTEAGTTDDIKEFKQIENIITDIIELSGMTDAGYIVNTRDRICDCKNFNKFGMCVHIVNACKRVKISLPHRKSNQKAGGTPMLRTNGNKKVRRPHLA
ncbi:hypothetical protein BC833DRAFT_573205 [Globomyces pollinis-pini]|nr:hypothetical protein BC833DRAFT_573205 [Globomyces pollinis-pini]